MIKDPTQGCHHKEFLTYHKRCLKKIFKNEKAYGNESMMQIHRQAASAYYGGNDYEDLQFINRIASLIVAYGCIMPDNVQGIKDMLISTRDALRAINPTLVEDAFKDLSSETALDFGEYNYKNYPDEYFGEIYAYLQNMKPKNAYEAVKLAWGVLPC